MVRVDGVRRVGGWLVVDVDVAPRRWLWSADVLVCQRDPVALLGRFPGCVAVVYRGSTANIVVIRSGTGSPAPV